MCRFYGWTDDYVQSLDVNTFIEYWNAITVIEARQKLLDMNIAMMPHVDEKARKQFYSLLEKQANPVRKSTGKALSNKELIKILSNR